MSGITGLSELTIVIPTVSRPLFILRQHEYWRDTDARIVILDGASSPIQRAVVVGESVREHKVLRASAR